MSKFNYRFASILNAKEILEKKIKEDISLINREISSLKSHLEIVLEERIKTQREMIERSLRVSEFQSAKMYDSLLDKQIHLIERKIEQLRAKKEEKQIELIEKKKEVKAFEILKENQFESFTIDERRQELKDLNDIAIRNYSRDAK